MPGNKMRDSKLDNCYTRYKEIKGESIQEKLEQTIKSSQKEAELKAEDFIKIYMSQPAQIERSKRNTDLIEKKLLNKIIESKTWLLNSFNSEYINLSSLYAQDVPKMAEHITWYWLSLPYLKFEILNLNKYDDLKEALILINYHLIIYRLSDNINAFNANEGKTINWPKSENVELYYIESLEQKLNNLTAIKERIFEELSDSGIKYRKELSLVKDELSRKKTEFNSSNIELQLLKGNFFFQDDDLFTKYVFGDILPELKSVYDLLKYYKLYDSNWGYFCYCLTWNNATSTNPPQQRLTFNIHNSEFTADDLGYILHLLKKHYQNESQLPFIQWVMTNIEIISGHGKILKTEEDYIKFNDKSIRSYKSGKSSPNFYHEINLKLQSLL